MTRSTRPNHWRISSLARRGAAIALLVAAAGRPALAADASCQPAIDALRKQSDTPHHAFMTETAQFRGDKPEHTESISIGSAYYLLVRGRWRSVPQASQVIRQEMMKDQGDAKSRSCSHVRDEAVGGEAAAVYRIQDLNEAGKVDSTLWVSRRTGLPLRQDIDLDVGGSKGKSHRSIRYDYTDVKPPAGVR
ncbi:MAG TPA: hypothetical protein VGE98_16785 [Thermoanaerobaculia bacterium]